MAQARPVAFFGGWTLMNENRPDQDEAMVGYTFQRRLAAGIHGSTYRSELSEQTEYVGPILSFLPMRLNEEGRQSNIYMSGSYGAMGGSGSPPKFVSAYAYAVEADSETRTFYTSVRHEVAQSSLGRFAYTRARLGFSPYLAVFGGLHAFVIMQGDYESWRRRGDVTPLLRFALQNVLWELGSSLNGKLQFNWTVEI